MKFNSNILKAVALKTFSQAKSVFAAANSFLEERNINKKLVALILMTALLMPVFLFGGLVKSTNAQRVNLSSSINQPTITGCRTARTILIFAVK